MDPFHLHKTITHYRIIKSTIINIFDFLRSVILYNLIYKLQLQVFLYILCIELQIVNGQYFKEDYY